MNCNDCNYNSRGDSISFVAHESDMARLERTIKRGFILNLVLIWALVISWAGFLIYESQMETVTEETIQEVRQTSEDSGNNSFVGGDYYGEPVYQDDDQTDIPPSQGNTD